jgi:hypothetical protein
MTKLKEEFFKILPPTIYFFVALRFHLRCREVVGVDSIARGMIH